MSKAHYHYKRGNALRSEGKDELAIDEFEKALALDPAFWMARKSIDFLKKHIEKKHLAFGSLYESEGKIKEALAEYKHACAINPVSWRTLKKIGMLYKDVHDFDKARHYLQQAVMLSPTHGPLYVALACIADIQEQFSEALRLYDLALRFSPHNCDIVHHKRLTQKLLHTFSELHRGKKTSSFYIEAATLYSEKHLTEKALTILKQALKRFPEEQEIFFMLGTLYYQSNKFKMAYRCFRHALSRKHAVLPAEEIHYNIGLTLAALEKWKEALAEWQACMRMAPRSRAALRAKANLALIAKKKYPQ